MNDRYTCDFKNILCSFCEQQRYDFYIIKTNSDGVFCNIIEAVGDDFVEVTRVVKNGNEKELVTFIIPLATINYIKVSNKALRKEIVS